MPASRENSRSSYAPFADLKAGARNFVARMQAGQPASTPQPASFTEDDLQQFLNMSHEAMVIASAAGQILQANQTFYNIFGYGAEDLKKMHFLDLFEAQDRAQIRSAIQSSDLSEKHGPARVEDFETRIISKNGDLRWMQWRQQLCDGKLYCSGRDITAIKEQQKALSRREKQLSQAESIGRMGHWTWTLGEDRIEWSQEIYRIFGVQQSGYTPTLQEMNAMVHRDDIARVNQAFQRAIIEENDYDMEFRINRPDGELRFIRCEGRCSFDTEGEVVALYGIMQDMTERMLYERNLKEAKEAAERAYAAKTQFLANMSHELRTPLNAIIGFSEMIENQLLGPIGTPKYLEYVTGIRESGVHLLDLISDILDMSKIEAGKYELDLEDISIAKIIKLAAHMMEGRAHDGKVKLEIDQNLNEDLHIIADRRAVLQILLNLLSNAVKFTGKDGGKVSLQLFERENHITFKVSDNGIGIPANKLAHITKPFEQVSTSHARSHEGSGLGLAITKELVEMHGGTLFIESTLGKGTIVTVRLPYDAFKARAAKTQKSA